MHIKNLEIHNFRNYSNFKIDFEPHINIIYGDNGQGKTNLLESIYVLALTKSHRAYIESNLIKDGEKEAVLKGTILMDMPYNLYLHLGKSTKHLKIDDNPVKTISSYQCNYFFFRGFRFNQRWPSWSPEIFRFGNKSVICQLLYCGKRFNQTSKNPQ